MRRKKLGFLKLTPYIFALILVLALLILFFFQQNTLAKERSLLKDYAKKQASLLGENENLQMYFFEKNRLENIEKISKELNFEKTEKIHYIRVLEGTVVAK